MKMYPKNRELRDLITEDDKTVACQTLKEFHSSVSQVR